MPIFLSILLSTFAISLISFSGSFLLFLKTQILEKISMFLVAFAAGALMGAAFLHVLPEALGEGEGGYAFVFILIGFSIFFFIEKILHWHHVHRGITAHKSLGTISLLGDGLHNFLDGMIIAATFFIDVKLGVVTTAAVALHEIPQEISEFGVLLYSGFSKYKALFFNFLSASTVVAGGVISYFLEGFLGQWIVLFLMFAVGTFMYVAASDFVPEIRKETGLRKSMGLLSVFVMGISLMWILSLFE